MRTTLNIDDDVLAAARELAAAQKTTAGKVISGLVRRALTESESRSGREYRNGLRLTPRAERVVTPELIEELLEPKFCAKTGLWDV
jgi:hypothetical protein